MILNETRARTPRHEERARAATTRNETTRNVASLRIPRRSRHAATAIIPRSIISRSTHVGATYFRPSAATSSLSTSCIAHR